MLKAKTDELIVMMRVSGVGALPLLPDDSSSISGMPDIPNQDKLLQQT